MLPGSPELLVVMGDCQVKIAKKILTLMLRTTENETRFIALIIRCFVYLVHQIKNICSPKLSDERLFRNFACIKDTVAVKLSKVLLAFFD